MQQEGERKNKREATGKSKKLTSDEVISEERVNQCEEFKQGEMCKEL